MTGSPEITPTAANVHTYRELATPARGATTGCAHQVKKVRTVLIEVVMTIVLRERLTPHDAPASSLADAATLR